MDCEASASLVDVYLALKQASVIAPSPTADEVETVLDAIYRRIVDQPVRDMQGARDKLRFASHCLDEEGDVKEAVNLIEEVVTALHTLANPPFDDD
jgi:hypothetical protein